MNTLSNPSFDRNDLVNLISKSQEYIEILKSIISIEDLQGITPANLFAEADSQFSPEALNKLEEKVAQTRMTFENDSSILLELPDKPSVEYNCKQMGFRSQETKTWRMLIDILSSSPHIFNFGIAYTYPDGSKKNRQKCKDYDARWKLLDELNKKLLVFFKREFGWNFPNGYKLYKNSATGSDGEKIFKFIAELPSSEDEAASLNNIEKRFLFLDENALTREIRALNDDFSMDSFVHNDPPEFLIAALNVGKNKFGWHDEKVREIIQY
jgi:hypothetical protein